MLHASTLRSPGGARVVLIGGILGLTEEGAQVAAYLKDRSFDSVLLGIPFEDLDAIRATSGDQAGKEFSSDDADELYLKQLARYGKVQVPPSDLYAAFAYAQERGIPVEAVDLGDEGHTTVWTENVGFVELMRNNRRLKRLGAVRFQATTAEDFAKEWDHALFPTKGLQRVQQAREEWMAKRVSELASKSKETFVLVPFARWAGVERRLVEQAGFRRER